MKHLDWYGRSAARWSRTACCATVRAALAALAMVTALGSCRESSPVATPQPAASAVDLASADAAHAEPATEPNSSQPSELDAPVQASPVEVDAPIPAGDVSRNDDLVPSELERMESDEDVAPALAANYTHRLLILLPQGPRVCDLEFVVAGQPYEDALNDLIDEVLTVIDRDSDGNPTWQEATTEQRLILGQYGNERITNENQRMQVVYRCDINRNGRVDVDELSAFLTSQPGLTHWVSVSDATSAGLEQRPAALFDWLDDNRDGQLDASEMLSANHRLRLLDSDDDGVLILEDLGDRNSSRTSNARLDSESTLILLHSDTDWSRVLFMIEDRYAYGSPLQPADLPRGELLFEQLDQNADGYWSVEETEALLTRPADLLLSISWDEQHAEIDLHTDLPTRRTTQSAIRVELASGGLTLQATADPASSSVLSGLDDAWQRFDQNEDGALDRDEYSKAEPLLGVPFEATDEDQDDLVTRREAHDALVDRGRANQVRIQLRLAEDTRPLWNRLDTDHDGRIVESELRRATEVLRELGRDSLSRDDLPLTHELTIVRGLAQAGPMTPVAQAGEPSQRPAWFEQMDQNRDGEISRREFLGGLEIFDALDQNQNGAIQIDEISTDEKPEEVSSHRHLPESG